MKLANHATAAAAAVLGVMMVMPASAQPAAPLQALDRDPLTLQVAEAERAFARTMAQRDLAAFAQFVSEDALFFAGRKTQKGRAEVVAAWKRFFDGAQAPFSWAPDQVELAPGGQFAYSTGPVWGPDGKLISRFNTVWRLESPGVWRVLYDRGEALPCDCAKP
ncbi:YybH family protein [Roseateles toxinivorans]|uniref:Ketosteroid isomerase-like protein n=1 Tax=Roseateles toxinivorans TaxID=270368 RepID=A0A4R6QMI1_9BURK|nr:nuclear transport factor 2 family protein [Roseateles toxinivorans]TDP71699.1 ketosteroid isomerase-like protein [Roseateles toxinivorans]